MDKKTKSDYWSHVPVWHIGLFLGATWWTIDILILIGIWWFFAPHTIATLLTIGLTTTILMAIISTPFAIGFIYFLRQLAVKSIKVRRIERK